MALFRQQAHQHHAKPVQSKKVGRPKKSAAVKEKPVKNPKKKPDTPAPSGAMTRSFTQKNSKLTVSEKIAKATELAKSSPLNMKRTKCGIMFKGPRSF